MRWAIFLLVFSFLCALTANAQNQDNVLIQDAKQKAVVYASKMAKTLNLSQKQTTDIYKLRFELSLALQIMHSQHSNNEAKLMEVVKHARKDFHSGIMRVLNEEQTNQWNAYRKDIVESQQYNETINSTASCSGY
jgi:L-rhamnose mutarotase